MAIKKKALKDGHGGADELRELIDQVGDGENGEDAKPSRRGMLKMAGAALAGAAGAAALRAVPAAAATGSAVLQGCYNFATTDQPTYLLMSSTGTGEGGSAFVGRGGAIGVTGEGYYSNDHNSEIGVFGESKAGPGTGVAGHANSGIGVGGNTSSGFGGMFISGTGIDIAAGAVTTTGTIGTGRLGMVGRTDIGGSAPGWNPGFQVSSTGTHFFQHELVRGNDGSIWASRADSSSASAARWKRVNAVRVDAADGSGAVYKPFRVVDTRPTKRAAGTTNTFTIAGTGTLTQHIPADAIAVIGNVTATGFTAAGYLSVFPAGVANPGTSTVNFSPGQTAIANSFVCGLGNGQLSVFVGAAASNIIIDITGYIQ